jgi:hypothetical protein
MEIGDNLVLLLNLANRKQPSIHGADIKVRHHPPVYSHGPDLT